jgi:hypothetical protein
MTQRTTKEKPPLWRFSATLTRRERLLAVVAAINPAQATNATLIHARTQLGVEKISRELRLLEEVGLLREAPSERRTVDFDVVDRRAWNALRELARAVEEERIAVA